jgi:hypothetical protein
MPIDPVIALGIKTPQFSDPLESYAKAAAIQGALQQQDTGALQQQQLRQQLGEHDRVLAAFRGMRPGQSMEDILPSVMQASPTTGIALQKNLLDNKKTQSEIDTQRVNAFAAGTKVVHDLIAQASSDADMPMIKEAMTKFMGPQYAAKVPDTFSPQWQAQAVMNGEKLLEKLNPKATFVDQGGVVQPRNPYTGDEMGAAIPKTATPGEVMTDKRMRDLQSLSTGTPEGDANLERQINYWAEVVRSGGALPPGLARGPGGSAFVREVTKRAALGDVTPKDLMSNQADFVGEKAGRRTLGTRTANIEMAATEAASLAELAKQASAKVDRTQYKAFNDVMQAGQRATASPELRAFTASNTSLINAYARAINPQGVGTVADKEHARDMLSTAFSKGDYDAAVNQLLMEIDAARKSPGTVKREMSDRFTGREAAPVQSAPAGVTRDDIDAELRRRGVIK